MHIKYNIKMILAYDGTGYLGWQKTDTGRSIEETLQTVLEQIFQTPTPLQAASRTDAGVHADGQVVNFFIHSEAIDLKRLQISLNQLLTKEIAVLALEEAPLSFHPTLHCTGKEYHYYLSLGTAQLPRQRHTAWHIPQTELNLKAIATAASFLVGRHDFAAFCNAAKNSSYESTIREVLRITLIELPDNQIRIEVRGNNFLYKMVRNIVGTMVDVGRGKLAAEQVPAILANKDRTLAGVSAPAHGLTLFKVFY